jgi:hypothetical protein
MAYCSHNLVGIVSFPFSFCPTKVFSMALCSTASSYEELLAFSIVASLGSGICETVAVMAIDDIFFLHGNLTLQECC